MTTLHRATRWHRLETEPFDLLVVGGGINGAGIARDAARRGLATALVEARDFASGTSSRSSRLVHGGVRYLEHGWLHLVFEASRERRTLLEIAPHLVRPLAFTWPVYRGARVPRWKLGAGLMLYDLLALFRNVANHDRLDAHELRALEPALRSDALTGGARYFDAQTSDTRLTLANALDAEAAGAVVLNHAAVSALRHDAGRVVGAEVVDEQSGTRTTVRARVVVNAAGPWSDAVRRLDDARVTAGVRGTKGVHLMLDRTRVGNRGALTLLSPLDGRVMFILPWGRFTIIGTTDTYDDAPPDAVRAEPQDVAYLLETANHFFPAAHLTAADVISSWAGLRPLVASASQGAPSNASREHELVHAASGLLSITGGKLTTYRSMSEEVVNAVEVALGRSPSPSTTASQPLPGGDFTDLAAEEAAASAAAGDAETGAHWVAAYGTAWRRVAALVAEHPTLADRLAPPLPYRAAEVIYAARQEHAVTVGDILMRRVPIAFELADQGASVAPRIAALLGETLGWSPEAQRAAVDAYAIEAARVFALEVAPLAGVSSGSAM
ncbi:MAG: glycerol-3-phosphate dehydrogenase [Gemmatimonadaceae bacterium]|nr:glycerol-3-phosphate dehydrogenase [Gemmatimonadaceae bacterium]